MVSRMRYFFYRMASLRSSGGRLRWRCRKSRTAAAAVVAIASSICHSPSAAEAGSVTVTV